MHNELAYWRNHMGSYGSFSVLPRQFISDSKKDEKWERNCLDGLENEAYYQLCDNLRLVDYDNIRYGRMGYSQLSDVMGQFSDLEEALKDFEIPTEIKHYDLIGVTIRSLVSEYMENQDKFFVHSGDEFAKNEFIREQTDRFKKYLKEATDKELKIRMIQMGLDPFKKDFQSNQEKEEYIALLRQKKEELTPPEIIKDLNDNFKSVVVKWANGVLEQDSTNFKLSEKVEQELYDFLYKGKCFRHYKIAHDYYEPETWSANQVFFEKTLDTKYIQEGGYVGRLSWMSVTEVIDNFGHKINKKDKEDLLDRYANPITQSGINSGETKDFYQSAARNFLSMHEVPYADYYGHSDIIAIEDKTGAALSNRTVILEDGSTKTFRSKTPRRNNGGRRFSSYIAKHLRPELNLDSAQFQVLECYWRGYEKVGIITFEDDNGTIITEKVSEKIHRDFLKEKGITQTSKISLEELQKKLELKDKSILNTIAWDYEPIIYKGLKINSGRTESDKSLYFVEKMDLDLKGHSNIYTKLLPVAGIADNGIAPILHPYQDKFNLVMNQLRNLMEKEIGLFYVMDVTFIPNEFKDGSASDYLHTLMDTARDTGILPVNGSAENTKGQNSAFNQFTPVNLSYAQQIRSRVEQARFLKEEAYQQIGFSPQRLGSPTAYETAEGVRQSQNASFGQTDTYLRAFSGYLQRAMDMHIAVAQFCQKTGKDLRIPYSKSDTDLAFIKQTVPNFPLTRMNVRVIDNPKQRREQKALKQAYLSNNTLGASMLDYAEIVYSDTTQELLQAAKNSMLRQEQDRQKEFERQSKLLEKQSELSRQDKIFDHELQEISKDRDRQTKIDVANITGLGRGVDKKSDQAGLQAIESATRMAQKEREMDINSSIKREELALEKKTKDREYDLALKDNMLKMMEIRQRGVNQRSEERIARINDSQ